MDDLKLPAWIASVVRDVLNDPATELSLLILHERQQLEKVSAQSSFRRKAKRVFSRDFKWKNLFWQYYCRWDEKRSWVSSDPFELVDLSDEFKNIPSMSVVPIRDRFFHSFEELDIERIRDANLDVILRFGFNVLKGPILKAARNGVWSYHHGDNQEYRGAPPYFWELYHHATKTGVILQRLNEKLDSGQVLYRSYGANVPGISVLRNRTAQYWKSSSFVLRRLRQLHTWGEERFENELATLKEDPSVQGKLYFIPKVSVLLRFLVRSFIRSLVFRFKMFGKCEQWEVAYRLPHLKNGYQILRSPKNHYYADPFPFIHQGKTYLFFEDFLYLENRGVISVVQVNADLSTSTPEVILDVGFHLSYPMVFEDDDKVYMIPESGENETVDLYVADVFPSRWRKVKTLKQGLQLYDVTLLKRDGLYWFFGTGVERGSASSDELFLFYSATLMGEWTPHPLNPIVSDVRNARPAGHFFERNGKLIRPS